MLERIEQIEKEAEAAIAAAPATAELEELRVRYLGRKAELTDDPARDRRAAGGRARGRSARPATRRARELEALLGERGAELDASELGDAAGRGRGRRHPARRAARAGGRTCTR